MAIEVILQISGEKKMYIENGQRISQYIRMNGKKASRNKERCQQQALLMITQADMSNKITNKKFLSLLRFDI